MNSIISLFLSYRKPQLFVLCFLAFGVSLSGCSQSKKIEENSKWVGTWSTAQQLVEPRNKAPEPGLAGHTIRQIVHVSLGGEQLRVSLSNAFSTDPVIITAVHVAYSTDSSAIDVNTDVALTFEGASEITIPAGEAVLSDPFEFDLEPLSNVAITMFVESISSDETGHPGSRTTSFIAQGNAVSNHVLDNATTADHWYIIDAIDVMAPEAYASLAILGNSITDGRGSGTNKQNRWPDELSKRLQANPNTQNIGVLNQGIGGNCVLKPCLGPSALDRFERDVLNQPGIKWLIIFEGINDIGGIRDPTQGEEVTTDLIAAYQQMIDEAHKNNILVYGATLMPFGGSFYDSKNREQARKAVNTWIRTSGKFDAVIDLDKAMGDPENPTKLIQEGDDGDGLHPSQQGHQLIAEAINLALFES